MPILEKIIWIIDPLDGTSDFIDRTGEFTVMISLIENKTLADLNSKYFTPIGRTIPENHIFKIELFYFFFKDFLLLSH